MISCGDNLHVFIHSKIMEKVNLASFTTGNFDKGAGGMKQALWFFVSAMFVRASWNQYMGIKIFLLRAFGAKIGRGLVIKNNVTVKFPWKLTLGDNCWLEEPRRIDNLHYEENGNKMCI